MSDHYLVLSDMHFGTPESSINQQALRSALVRHLVEGAPWKEIIFTGDLLDANLATFRQAIEGDGDVRFGFRAFVREVDAALAASGGLAAAAERWIYLPGNHDYRVWDLLATRYAFEDVLAHGDTLGTVPMPLQHHAWAGDDSFFAGIFRPFHAADRVRVEYPNHLVAFDGASMVFTHGHYLDPSQTRGNELSAHLGRASTSAARDEAVGHIVKETAQYQAVASAVSYTRETQRLASALVGPDGLADKARTILAALGDAVLRLVFGRKSALRGSAISARQLTDIGLYVTRFSEVQPPARWFVFGHTHRQGHAATPGLDVYNVGSCYPDHDLPITFAEVDRRDDGEPEVRLMCVDRTSAVRPSPLA